MKKKAKITPETVKHVASLASLELNQKELKKFQKQLSEILDYIEILKEVKTAKIEPTSQVTGQENVFQQDKTGSCLSQEEALSGTKDQYQGRFRVKAIFEEI